MSGGSSNAAAWFTLLEPASSGPPASRRPDDPRLGEIIEPWNGELSVLRTGRAMILGFPQDEGVRRNGGRVGAAKAPNEIRKYLHRLTASHAQHQIDLAACGPLDAGNVRVSENLEESQEQLGSVIGGILRIGAVPIVLGGGHETAYGHYLGYANNQIPVGIINIDAHLDVRPCLDGHGHSGSPFRQAMDHPGFPLPGSRYVCLGAQPFAVSQQHFARARTKGAKIRWAWTDIDNLAAAAMEEVDRLATDGCRVMLTIDADAFAAADVPGVSAPNPHGLPGGDIAAVCERAGQNAKISSMELVEINPTFDVDGRSARWAAMAIWHFLVGLARRSIQAS
jgi:formiminoglutamase